MAKHRSKLLQRIETRRQQGQSPVAIARYVHNTCYTSWSRKLSWTLSEREELERLDREAAERKAEKAQKKAADTAEFQGEQHYKPVALFGGEEGFRATQARDARKRACLTREGVVLAEWCFNTPIVAAELDRALAFVKSCHDLAGDAPGPQTTGTLGRRREQDT